MGGKGRVFAMKLKKVRIVIHPVEDIKADWKAALHGERYARQAPNTLIFPSLASVAKVLSPTRMELLGVIVRQKPESIYALAQMVERDFKNVHADVKLLAEVGLVVLRPCGKRDAVKPMPKFSGIELDWAA
jgi:predicted transcriptional regulator